MISERLQGKLPALPDDATDAQRLERNYAEARRDIAFIAGVVARTADSLNAEEHKAVAAYLKEIFSLHKSLDDRIAVLEAENKTLAESALNALKRIVALESAAKPA